MASSGFELICTVLWLRPIIAFPLLLAPDRALVLDVWPPSSPSGLHSHTCLHTLPAVSPHDSPIPQSGHVMFSGCPLSVLFPQPLQPLKFQRKHPFPGSCPPSSWARLRPPPQVIHLSQMPPSTSGSSARSSSLAACLSCSSLSTQELPLGLVGAMC